MIDEGLPLSPLSGPATPDDDFALARETPLTRVIAAEIEQSGGRITFERFMALALGHPQYGYYTREHLAWGADGDYETSPEVHPIFGYLWARQLLECWERLDRPDPFHVVEPGGGSGAFAAAMLGWLRERAPDCFAATRAVILDGHEHRLAQQRRTMRDHGLEAEHLLLDEWLDREPAVTGVVIANEFFDALPAHLVERRGEQLREWYVESSEGGLGFSLGPASTPEIERYFERLGLTPGEGCRAELSPAAVETMRLITGRIDRGYVIAIDYGHEAVDLYASWRRMGTLMAFRRHSPQPDPLASPGLLDLTYHVDLTSLATAAEGDGWERAATVSQAEALTALGIGDAMQAATARAGRDALRFASDRRAAQTLLDPTELGRIRVLVQARGASLDGLRCLRDVASGDR